METISIKWTHWLSPYPSVEKFLFFFVFTHPLAHFSNFKHKLAPPKMTVLPAAARRSFQYVIGFSTFWLDNFCSQCFTAVKASDASNARLPFFQETAVNHSTIGFPEECSSGMLMAIPAFGWSLFSLLPANENLAPAADNFPSMTDHNLSSSLDECQKCFLLHLLLAPVVTRVGTCDTFMCWLPWPPQR